MKMSSLGFFKGRNIQLNRTFFQGLRLGVLLGSAGTCAGSWLKVLATGPDQWWLTFLGQSVVAVSQIFILGIPAQLAATWFPPNQMSSATSIGVFGNQVWKRD